MSDQLERTEAVDEEGIWQLLQRGGMPRNEVRAGPPEPGPLGPLTRIRIPKYNGLADPLGAEELGRLLSQRLRPFGPTAVLLWEDPQDVVLGHIVARELGIIAVRSYNEEVLIELAGTLPPKSRVLLLTDAFRDAGLLRAMRGIVERHGGTVVASAALAQTDALATVDQAGDAAVSLVSARADAGPTEVTGGDGRQ